MSSCHDPLPFGVYLKLTHYQSSQSNVGSEAVAALYGAVDNSEYGLYVTLGSFTNPAKNFAKGKTNLRLIDGEELVSLLLSHYEELDLRFKGILPLKRVYVPEAEAGDTEDE